MKNIRVQPFLKNVYNEKSQHYKSTFYSDIVLQYELLYGISDFLFADEIIVTNGGGVEQVGTPRELYSHPETPYVARFIGSSTSVKEYWRFRFFKSLGDQTSAVVRPEYVKVFRKDENKKFAKSAEEGIVDDVIFRGDNLEIRVRIHDVVLSATRSINDPVVEVGEKVDVFVYRFLVVDGEKIILLDNSSLREESVVI